MTQGTLMQPRRVVIGCDLFLDLKLYHLPDEELQRLREACPFIEVVELNTGGELDVALDTVEVYWGNRITRDLISRLPSLKWIHFGSVGVDRAVTPEVSRRNIVVTNSRGVMVGAMVATTVGFMCALARGFHYCWQLRAKGALNRRTFDQYFQDIHDLEDETCLIVGCGDVGRRLVAICVSLGMKVIAIKNDISQSNSGVQGVYGLDQLGQVVKDADYVINLLPLTPSTRGVFDAAVFNNMKPRAFFINVGRGETVREEDLISALTNGVIAGAGLDVFSVEPPSPDWILWRLPNVVLTPHVAGVSKGYWKKECALMRDNLWRYVNQEPLLNVVDMHKGY